METPASPTSEPLDAALRKPLWRRIRSMAGRGLSRSLRFWRVTILRRPRPIDRWIADRGDQTLRLNYPLSSSSVVVDVGGFQGDWSEQILNRHGCNIHIFEPVSAYRQNISRRFGGCAAVSIYPFGLSNTRALTQIAVLGDASSVFVDGQQRGEMIELRDAAEILEPLRIHGIDLIKINIEGGEYDLLTRMIDTGIARACRDIQVQFHPWIPEAAGRRKAIQEALSRTHSLTWEYPFVWENWRLKE